MIMYLKWKIQDVRKKNGEPIKGLKLAAAIMKVFRRFSTHLCMCRKEVKKLHSLADSEKRCSKIWSIPIYSTPMIFQKHLSSGETAAIFRELLEGQRKNPIFV